MYPACRSPVNNFKTLPAIGDQRPLVIGVFGELG